MTITATPQTALCQLLVAALAPAAIYKVEHRLQGDAGLKLFCNLIVLLPDTRPKATGRYDPVLQLAQLSPVPVQCTIHHVHTVAGWIARGHPFFCRHIVPQNRVYSGGRHTLPEADPAMMQEVTVSLRLRFAQLYGRAREFYRCACAPLVGDSEANALAAFMLHQSVELGFRAILETLNGCCKKTHELRQLRDQCSRCSPALSELFAEAPGEPTRLLNILEAAYSGARYDSGFVVSEGDLEQLTEQARVFLDAAEDVFGVEMDF